MYAPGLFDRYKKSVNCRQELLYLSDFKVGVRVLWKQAQSTVDVLFAGVKITDKCGPLSYVLYCKLLYR